MGKYFLFIALIALCWSCNDTAKSTEREKEKKNDPDAIFKQKMAELDSVTLFEATYLNGLPLNHASVTEGIKEKLKDFRESKDEFKEVTFYNHKKEPKGWANDISIYIVKKDSTLFERIQFAYKSDDWLFVRKYQVLCDGKKFEFIPDEVKRDYLSGEIYEYSDDIMTTKAKDMIAAIISSKVAKMRYVGKDYYKDRTISNSEKNRLKDVFTVLY